MIMDSCIWRSQRKKLFVLFRSMCTHIFISINHRWCWQKRHRYKYETQVEGQAGIQREQLSEEVQSSEQKGEAERITSTQSTSWEIRHTRLTTPVCDMLAHVTVTPSCPWSAFAALASELCGGQPHCWVLIRGPGRPGPQAPPAGTCLLHHCWGVGSQPP